MHLTRTKTRPLLQSLAGLLIIGSQPLLVAGDFAVPLASEAAADQGDWEFIFGMNMWAPQLSATSATGSSVQLGVDEIVDDLKMAFMASLVARKDRWFVGSDLIYMELQDDVYGGLGPATARASVDLTGWIITPAVGYSLFSGERGTFDVMAGARYLYLDVDADAVVSLPPLGTTTRVASESGSSWAGVIGFKGHYNLSEKWFIPYYFDIGAGEPDLTLQAYLGIGYRAEKFEVSLGYRYLKFDFERGSALSDLEAKGVMLGLHFPF